MLVRIRSLGFSPIAVVIGIFVVSIVGFGGWYVWHTNQKTSSTDETSNNSSAQTAQTQPTTTSTSTANETTAAPTESTEQVDQYAGWKTYTFDNGTFSFKYPSDWTTQDATEGSNTYLRLILESPTKPYGSVELIFDVIQERFIGQYDVEGDVRNLDNGIRLWTESRKTYSKKYNNFQPFDCAQLQLLDTAKDQDVTLPGNKYLRAQGGFCSHQDSYTTKSYTEQLDSSEIKDLIKIYESISIKS